MQRRRVAAVARRGGRIWVDLGKDLTDLDDVVWCGENLGDHAGGGCRNLGVDLVGRDFDKSVALGDLLALGDMPLEDRSLGDRLPHLGHLQLDYAFCHVLDPVYAVGSGRARHFPPVRRR